MSRGRIYLARIDRGGVYEGLTVVAYELRINGRLSFQSLNLSAEGDNITFHFFICGRVLRRQQTIAPAFAV